MAIRMSFLALLSAALVLITVPVRAAEIVPDALAAVQAEVAKRCKTVIYGEDFADNIDFNNDRLVDAIFNLGAVNCDGVPGGLCGDVGCPHEFYISVAEGGYFLAANADLYGYDMKKRFGNMVLELKANAASCGRDDSEYCVMTVRVRNARFETISKK
jgi:hypothetical protein